MKSLLRENPDAPVTHNRPTESSNYAQKQRGSVVQHGGFGLLDSLAQPRRLNVWVLTLGWALFACVLLCSSARRIQSISSRFDVSASAPTYT